MTLTEELSKSDYNGLTNEQVFEIVKNKKYTQLTKIAYGETLHLVSMLARGLRDRINACLIPTLKAAWVEALRPEYLSSPSYSINVSLPEIKYMLDQGKANNICTQAEYDFIIQLATKEYYTFPDVTLIDVIKIRNPELLSDGSYTPIAGKGRTVLVNVTQPLPTESSVRIEVRESYDGVLWTNWQRVNHIYNVKDVGLYHCQWQGSYLPYVEMRMKNETFNMSATAQAV
jgi:hypothetical protein